MKNRLCQLDAARHRLALERTRRRNFFDDGILQLAAMRTLTEPRNRFVMEEIDHETKAVVPPHIPNTAIDREMKSVAVSTKPLKLEVGTVGTHQVDVAAIVDRVPNITGNEGFDATYLSRVPRIRVVGGVVLHLRHGDPVRCNRIKRK
jgi:hypothetical protein